jgi:hypothetical protein
MSHLDVVELMVKPTTRVVGFVFRYICSIVNSHIAGKASFGNSS